MQPVHLHRIDAEANMARFYTIEIAPTLFGEVSVLLRWGRSDNDRDLRHA